MRQFGFKSLLVTLPILVLLVSVNYFGDAARLFDADYEKKMAEIIMDGSFVTNINNYDERVFQLELITQMNEAPEVLVLGSSRTMLIRSAHFPNNSFFNNSVSGASIEDIIALFQIYKERKLLPKKIIVGVDPWLFNENNGQTRWMSLETFYNKYNKKSPTQSSGNALNKYGELFSLSYFQSSSKALYQKINGTYDPVPTLNEENTTNTKLSDGSLVYREDYRNATQNEIDAKIDEYTSGRIYSVENFDAISDRYWDEFHEFIAVLEKEG
jgi:hypothetical protein